MELRFKVAATQPQHVGWHRYIKRCEYLVENFGKDDGARIVNAIKELNEAGFDVVFYHVNMLIERHVHEYMVLGDIKLSPKEQKLVDMLIKFGGIKIVLPATES